jgi:isocitrate/isopropylmalate dehydrogenase
VVRAIETLVAEGKTVTRDLGGKASTREVGETLAALI